MTQTIIATLAEQAKTQEAASQGIGGSIMSLLPMLIVMAVLIYFMWRGQKKEQKRRQEMIEGVKVGDNVLTIGGIAGEVVGVKEDRFVVKIAENVKIEIIKTAVSAVPSKEEAPK